MDGKILWALSLLYLFLLWQGEVHIKCTTDTRTLNSLATLWQTQKQANVVFGQWGSPRMDANTTDFHILISLGSHRSVLHEELVQQYSKFGTIMGSLCRHTWTSFRAPRSAAFRNDDVDVKTSSDWLQADMWCTPSPPPTLDGRVPLTAVSVPADVEFAPPSKKLLPKPPLNTPLFILPVPPPIIVTMGWKPIMGKKK